MIQEYLKILKAISEIQKELISIDKKIKTNNQSIKQLLIERKELEDKKEFYSNKLNMLETLDRNKDKIDNDTFKKDVRSDMKKTFNERCNIVSKISENKSIEKSKLEYGNELDTKKEQVIKGLKMLYFKRDLVLESLFTIYDENNSNNVISENSKGRF